MIIAGILIANVNLQEVLTYKRIYLIALFRMIVYPSFALLLLKFTKLSTLHAEGGVILFITFLAVIAPLAICYDLYEVSFVCFISTTNVTNGIHENVILNVFGMFSIY
ncbi:MAG: putative permease [Firmicutes bacterium]|nr:putative permease [Bacillota bacterium]